MAGTAHRTSPGACSPSSPSRRGKRRPRGSSIYSGAIEILILCTGNICRSPMAEALLRRRLAELGVDATVHSAGLRFDGEPASTAGVQVLEGRGLDLSAHRSRIITAELLRRADLILAMAREHVREAVLMRPEVWPRTFTLKELVRRGEALGPRQPHEDVASWLERAGSGRRRSDLVGASEADDVADPIGLGRPRYEQTAEEIDALLERLVTLMWGKEVA